MTESSYVNILGSDLFDSFLPASTEYTCSCRSHLCLYMFLHFGMDFFHIHLCLKKAKLRYSMNLYIQQIIKKIYFLINKKNFDTSFSVFFKKP